MRITFKTLLFIRGHSTIEPEHKDCGKSGSNVMSLLEAHLGKGHTLYVDNWYASPALFGILHKHFTNACGTVKERRKGLPEMKNYKKEKCAFGRQ